MNDKPTALDAQAILLNALLAETRKGRQPGLSQHDLDLSQARWDVLFEVQQAISDLIDGNKKTADGGNRQRLEK